MYFSTKIDYPRIRHCNINRVKYSHKDLIANKEFSDIIKKDKNIIIKIKHILSLNFTQKTEVASLILNEIQKVESFKEQSVILAIALDDFTQKTMKDLTQMLGNADIKIKKNK